MKKFIKTINYEYINKDSIDVVYLRMETNKRTQEKKYYVACEIRGYDRMFELSEKFSKREEAIKATEEIMYELNDAR
jgi:hypothetical protein